MANTFEEPVIGRHVLLIAVNVHIIFGQFRLVMAYVD